MTQRKPIATATTTRSATGSNQYRRPTRCRLPVPRRAAFWVDLLGCPATEERANEYFIVDAGGLRLCVDREDGEVHRAGSTDPSIGLKVKSASAVLAELVDRGLTEEAKVITTARGAHVVIHDPEGRCVILTEVD